jgi:hypothetical protein
MPEHAVNARPDAPHAAQIALVLRGASVSFNALVTSSEVDMKALVLALGLIATTLAAPAQAQGRWHGQGAYFDPTTCSPRFCEESDWIYDDTRNDHTTVWRHRLGVTPRFVSILFTPDPDTGPVFPLIWP